MTLYAPLEPLVYSVGGIALALGMIVIARLYERILAIAWFFVISLLVEVVMLVVILYFLLFSYGEATALLVYIGYQFTFVFGGYLVRIETLLLQKESILKQLDTAKQLGYLAGMGVSYLFYRLLLHYGISQNQTQVYWLHTLLLGIEIVILIALVRSFERV